MENSTKQIRAELTKQIAKISMNNSEFAYLFTATDRDDNPTEVTVAINGDSEQIYLMLATVVQRIAEIAGVSEEAIMQGIAVAVVKKQCIKVLTEKALTDPEAAQFFVDGRLSFKVINPKFEVKQ